MELIQIQWTCGNIEEARRVARFLVQERLVACAQITPWMESVYMWNNTLQTEQECKVLFKAHKGNWGQIKKVILENCSYEVPELLWFSVDGVDESYLNWALENGKPLEPQQIS